MTWQKPQEKLHRLGQEVHRTEGAGSTGEPSWSYTMQPEVPRNTTPNTHPALQMQRKSRGTKPEALLTKAGSLQLLKTPCACFWSLLNVGGPVLKVLLVALPSLSSARRKDLKQSSAGSPGANTFRSLMPIRRPRLNSSV